MARMYHAILFDFDGVLCRDRFYIRSLLPEHQRIVDIAQQLIFGNSELCERWMRGKISSEDVNRIIARECKVDFVWVHQKFLESVRLIQLDYDIFLLVSQLKLEGRKIGIVTNNMDVFSDIVIKNCALDKLFDVIVNSSDYGMLKKDNNGKLFDIALEKIDVKIENSLMIDDSKYNTKLYHQKGGQSFMYKTYSELKKFLHV